MNAKCLMVQGTTSDAGKSAIVTGLCRILHRKGVKVAPFKPQNMALNSAVTIDGGEIGRAQAVQAQACGIEPHTDMNPILLKPNSEKGAQVIVCGQVRAEMSAYEYHQNKASFFTEMMAAYHRLASRYDVIIVEGAGSPAEINLRENDIANMGFARAVNCPVLLVADIERGGVFAQLVGTLELLKKPERHLVVGQIINRFRGDVSILQSGIDWLELKTDIPVLGTIPYLPDLYLESEDSLSEKFKANIKDDNKQDRLRVVVPKLPRLSNHTDFDALQLHPKVDFTYVEEGQNIPVADLILLPGSKNVMSDISWLRENKWDTAINKHLRYGGKLIGICGGYQILGKVIHDPHGIEGPPGSVSGLGLIEMETTLQPNKQLQRVTGELFLDKTKVTGYEIHAGISTLQRNDNPAIKLADRFDGYVSTDRNIIGTYLHGLFDEPSACAALLSWAGMEKITAVDMTKKRQQGFDQLANALEEYLDMPMIYTFIGH